MSGYLMAQIKTRLMCQWFALCCNMATQTRKHPILGDVPICDRCDQKVAKIEAGERKVPHQ